MKRYLIFLLLSIGLHGLVLIPFYVSERHRTPEVGGGEGASIHISLATIPEQGEGQERILSRPESASIPRGTDQGEKSLAGRGLGPSAGPGQGSGSGLAGSDSILAAIRSQIERSKRYPTMARRRGLEGKSDLSFSINPDGSVAELSLVKSAGVSVLDRAALATIRRAAPFPYFPDAIQIGIRFELED